jgi:hypothetical protein
MTSRQRVHYAVLIAAVGCLILALSCGLGTVAVRQGAVMPPKLNLQLGSVRVVGITSNSPDCTRLLIPGCTQLNQIPTVHIYTLWLFVQREQNSWDRPNIARLLTIKLGE